MASYIIKLDNGSFFTGWSTLDGSMKFQYDEKLAYRMRRPVAETTIKKIFDATFRKAKILQVA